MANKIYIFQDAYVYYYAGNSWVETQNSPVSGEIYYLVNASGRIVATKKWEDTSSMLHIGNIAYDYYSSTIYPQIEGSEEYYSLYYLEGEEDYDPNNPAGVKVKATLTNGGIAEITYTSLLDIEVTTYWCRLINTDYEIVHSTSSSQPRWDLYNYMDNGSSFYIEAGFGYSIQGDSSGQKYYVQGESECVEKENWTQAEIMNRIATEIRNKTNTFGKMNINDMIYTLNNVPTIGSANIDQYDDTNIESCIEKLAKVIRAKGNTTSKLKLRQMPDAIRNIQLRTNPLTLNIYTYSEMLGIEISSNAYMYEDAVGLLEWCNSSGQVLYSENIYYFDGNTYYYERNYGSEMYVHAVVTINAGGYKISGTSDSFYVPYSGSGENQYWDYEELWYFNDYWHTHNPYDDPIQEWYSARCPKCGAKLWNTTYNKSVTCGNTKQGEICGEEVYIPEPSYDTYWCNVYIGGGMYCHQSGYGYQGCPEHGFEEWYPYEPGS